VNVSNRHFYKTCAAAIAAVSLMMMLDMPQAFSATSDQISGKTCRQLLRSCVRICVKHQGEPAYKDCMPDCTTGSKTCKTTGTWTSKNATVTIPKR
jgi:hypothetical protein